MIIPSNVMTAHMEMCAHIPKPCSIGFTRVVKDMQGELFFSDIRRPLRNCPSVTQKNCLTECNNIYSAVWMHDREDTKKLLQRVPRPRSREQAASSPFVTKIPCNISSPNTIVYHTTYSRKGYFKHRDGFHSMRVGNGTTHWVCRQIEKRS